MELIDLGLVLLVVWVGMESVYLALRFTGFIPLLRVEKDLNSNASNNGWKIVMKESVLKSNSNAEGILSQEYREFFSRPLLAMRVAEVFSKKLQRRTEYKGHALEIAWFYKFVNSSEVEYYRWCEAEVLTRYKQFKGVAIDEIYAKLKYYDNDAMNYLSKHEYKIKRMYGKFEEKV